MKFKPSVIAPLCRQFTCKFYSFVWKVQLCRKVFYRAFSSWYLSFCNTARAIFQFLPFSLFRPQCGLQASSLVLLSFYDHFTFIWSSIESPCVRRAIQRETIANPIFASITDRVGYGSDSLTIGSNYTTRSQVASAVTPSSTTTAIDDNAAHRPIDPQAEKQKPRTPVHKRFYKTAKEIMFSSWVNCLLLFVPAGVAAHFASIHPTWIFVANAIAIVPLARLLSFATESVAHGAGDTLGAFLNVSFGNAVELIIECVFFRIQRHVM